MSEIIELLKRKNNYKTQEKLAEVYLPPSIKQKPAAASPPPKTRLRNIAAITLLAIAVISLVASLFYVLYSHTVTINVSINRRVESPFENLLLTEKVSLSGAAARQKGTISLIDDAAHRRSTIMIDLKEPIDLSHKRLFLNLLPAQGIASLRIVLRDKNYRSFISNTLSIDSSEEGSKNFILSATRNKESIDMQRIRHIRLELENGSAEDKESAEVHVKEVAIIDN